MNFKSITLLWDALKKFSYCIDFFQVLCFVHVKHILSCRIYFNPANTMNYVANYLDSFVVIHSLHMPF